MASIPTYGDKNPMVISQGPRGNGPYHGFNLGNGRDEGRDWETNIFDPANAGGGRLNLKETISKKLV